MDGNKYNYHYDFPNQRWNVFDPQGNYLCWFKDVEDARDFCSINNGVLEVIDAATN